LRKYNGALIICVQSFSDLQKTYSHKVIFENSAWTVLLKQDEKTIESLKTSEVFGEMIPLINSISFAPGKYSELLLYSTGVKVVVRLLLDPYSKALFSTDAEDYNFINFLVEDHSYNLDEAIETVKELKYEEGAKYAKDFDHIKFLVAKGLNVSTAIEKIKESKN